MRFLALLLLPVPALAQEDCPRPEPQTLEAVGPVAPERISVVVDPGLRRTLDLPTEGLRQARRDLLACLPVLDADLRALAERHDGLAAQRYVRRLLAAHPRGSDSDIAFFGSIAVATGRVWTLPAVVDALNRLDPATEPPERVAAYAAMLYPHAWAGNTLALRALIDLNGEGRLFGPMSEETRARILEMGDAIGDGRIPLHMATAILRTAAPTDADRAVARDSLARAAAGSDPATRAMAAALMGTLGPSTTKEPAS